MKYEDPPRLRDWLDEDERDLGGALEDLCRVEPSAQELGLLRQSVRVALGLPTIPMASHPTAIVSLIKAKWFSLVVAPLVVGAGAGLATVHTANKLLPAPSQVTRPSQTTTLAPVHSAPATPTNSGPSAPPEVPPLATAEQPNHPRAREQARSGTLSADDSPPPVEAPAAVGEQRRSAELRPGETEIGLLSRAQGALEGDPALALDLTRAHEERFGEALLVQEREVIAIEALVRLGRAREAESRALRFHTRFPRSAFRRRLDVLLGGSR